MNAAKALVLFYLGAGGVTSGCATTFEGRIYQNMAMAGLAGAVVGSQSATYQATRATMYAGVSAAIAAALTVALDGPDTETKRLREEVAYLKNQRELKDMNSLAGSSPATFGGQVPEKYRHMVKPGEWRIYDVDHWREDGENRLVHEDKVMELIPPSLSPNR